MKKLSLILIGLIAGCASYQNAIDLNKASPEERSAGMRVQLFPAGSLKPGSLKYVGPVKASACQGFFDTTPASESEALEQLKIITVRQGGNAVVDYSCEDVKDSLCQSEIVCTGTAARISTR